MPHVLEMPIRPIPGDAVLRFQAHPGTLLPHFTYGVLEKNDYVLAHVMHIANHWDDVVVLL